MAYFNMKRVNSEVTPSRKALYRNSPVTPSRKVLCSNSQVIPLRKIHCRNSQVMIDCWSGGCMPCRHLRRSSEQHHTVITYSGR